MAFPVNKYLNPLIVLGLSIKLPLLPLVGRQKLADAQGQVWRLVPPPAPLLSGTEWGTARVRLPVQVGDNRMIEKRSWFTKAS